MNLPPEQESIRARCFHPSGQFVEFPEENLNSTISKLFEQTVRRYPGRLALKMGDCALTYDELNRQANRIARVILETCGDAIRPIMIMADQSPHTLISCLGGLKAGKILVPVDSLFPEDRLSFMADDSHAEAILTSNNDLQCALRLEKGTRPVINIETIDNDISAENIDIQRSPLDPARIRYTSGSTGKPKGVLNNNRKSVFQCLARINRGHICRDDRLIVLRRLSFSYTDPFCGLLVGASVFPFDIKEQGLSSLAKFLRSEKITYFVSTPSVFRYFAQELLDQGGFPHLRMIKLGGEPLFRTDVELYKKHFPPECILLNQFSGAEMGPVCQYWIRKETEINTPIVPVGFPVEGTKVFLLRGDRKEVGGNEVGEIAVASSYLFSGYWNNAELTNDRVLTTKNSTDEKLYFTGDLGRRLHDGCLLYVGRKDDQVKIRGAKVEIREVEAVLSEHPQIRQSAIVAFDDQSGEKYLTGYIVPAEQSSLTTTAINGYLRKRLPDYMIPSVFVFLDELPLINGKLDRRSLPKPNTTRPTLDTPYAQARNDTESQLVRIWKEVLAVDPIGIHDNFFDLGGHSLAATRVISRVINHFRLEIQLQALFDSPTITDMAEVITAHQGKALDEQSLAAVLDELESLSDDEAIELAGDPKPKNSKH